jgi:hypothetical protein
MHAGKGFYTLQTLSRFVLFNKVMEAAGAKTVADPVEKASVTDSLQALTRTQTVVISRAMGGQVDRLPGTGSAK